MGEIEKQSDLVMLPPISPDPEAFDGKEDILDELKNSKLLVIAELEQFEGLSRDSIAENLNCSTSTVYKSAGWLHDRGLVEVVSERPPAYALTHLGRQAVSYLKTVDSEDLKFRNIPELRLFSKRAGASFNIIDHIIAESAYSDSEENAWLRQNDSDGGVAEQISLGIGGRPETITRRVYDLRSRNLMKVKYREKGKGKQSLKELVNLGVTKEGQEWHQQVVDNLEEINGLNVTSAIDDILELKEALGYLNPEADCGFSDITDLVNMRPEKLQHCRSKLQQMFNDAKSSKYQRAA